MLKNAMKRFALGFCALFVLAASPAVVEAADLEVETVFEDALYGGAIGALVGAGVMLVSSTPTDHWDYIVTGAGIGIIAGTAYGVYISSRSFAEIEDGKMFVGVPTPKVIVQKYQETAAVGVEADLLRIRF